MPGIRGLSWGHHRRSSTGNRKAAPRAMRGGAGYQESYWGYGVDPGAIPGGIPGTVPGFRRDPGYGGSSGDDARAIPEIWGRFRGGAVPGRSRGFGSRTGGGAGVDPRNLGVIPKISGRSRSRGLWRYRGRGGSLGGDPGGATGDLGAIPGAVPSRSRSPRWGSRRRPRGSPSVRGRGRCPEPWSVPMPGALVGARGGPGLPAGGPQENPGGRLSVRGRSRCREPRAVPGAVPGRSRSRSQSPCRCQCRGSDRAWGMAGLGSPELGSGPAPVPATRVELTVSCR